MLKEHMGSPAIVSAPSCITTANGLNWARTSCITLTKEKKKHLEKLVYVNVRGQNVNTETIWGKTEAENISVYLLKIW